MLASGRYGTLYVGVTSNLVGRLVQHRQGAFDGFTKEYGIHRLVWFEMTGRMEDAITTEKRIKRWRRDWEIALIERDNLHWENVAIGLGLPPATRRP